MSHAATNWAIRQRGLKSAAKIVLWHLADCHNPANGCYPTQAYLAEACEMSRSTLNLHLDALEKAGLIRRDTGVDDRTKRQRPTRYELAFEARAVSENKTRPVSGFQPEPCPDFEESRVRNPDTNLVREPVREPVTQSRERAMPFGVEGEAPSDDRFGEFWAAYPKHEGRDPAEVAFIRASIGTPAETIIAGAKAYAAARAGQEDRFTMLAARWLAERRWTDQPAKTPEPPPKSDRYRRLAAGYGPPT